MMHCFNRRSLPYMGPWHCARAPGEHNGPNPSNDDIRTALRAHCQQGVWLWHNFADCCGKRGRFYIKMQALLNRPRGGLMNSFARLQDNLTCNSGLNAFYHPRSKLARWITPTCNCRGQYQSRSRRFTMHPYRLSSGQKLHKGRPLEMLTLTASLLRR